MQSQWKLCQLQLKTWGSSTCVSYFLSVRCFELTSVRHGVCRRLWFCDGWRSKIVHQDWNFTWQNPLQKFTVLCVKFLVGRQWTGWVTRFRVEHVAINDDPRSGRPKTSTDERSVKIVADFLAQDRRATCEEISQATGISPTSVSYFSIDNAHLMYNAHPKLFRHSFWCIDNAHDVFFDR